MPDFEEIYKLAEEIYRIVKEAFPEEIDGVRRTVDEYIRSGATMGASQYQNS